MSDSKQQVRDLSFIILSEGKACGLFLLCAVVKDNKCSLSSYVQPIHSPMFLSEISNKQIKRSCSKIMDSLCYLVTSNICNPLTVQEGPCGIKKEVFCSEWFRQAMDRGSNCRLQYDMYVDLKLRSEQLKTFYRKSYKPLINKGLREWKVEVLTSDSINKTIWTEFRLLHKTIAGRVTRSLESWDIQYRMIEAGNAFFVSVRDIQSLKLVGGSLFQVTQHEGIYSIAAYDRSLFDKPLGHPSQHLAIEYMKSLGLNWYRLGEKLYPQSNPLPDQKEIDISHFKEGFCSKIFPRMILDIST